MAATIGLCPGSGGATVPLEMAVPLKVAADSQLTRIESALQRN